MTKELKQTIIFSNFEQSLSKQQEVEYKAQYREYRQLMNDTFEEGAIMDYNSWLQETLYCETSINWNDLTDELRNSTGRFMIHGNLSLWSGRHSVKDDTVYKNLLDPITKCLGNDTDEFRISHIEAENTIPAHIKIEATHHDGTNIFRIHALKEKYPSDKNISPKYWEDLELNF